MNEVSLKPVIEELENLFSKFNARFFDGGLEKPVITVSPDHTRGAIIRATKEVRVICADCDCEFQEEC